MAQIDASIALQSKLPQFDGPMDIASKGAQFQALQNQNQLAQLTLNQHTMDANQTAAVNQLYQTATGADGKVDRNALFSGLASQGMGSRIPALQKQYADADKSAADTALSNAHAANFGATTDTSNYDLRIKKSDQAIKDISGFKSPDEAKASLQQHIQAGDVDPQKGAILMQGIPSDPAQFPTWQLSMLRNIMTAKEQMAQALPDANARLTAETSRANNRDTNATTQHGQNLTDARSRDANNGAMMTPEYKQDTDGNWIALPKKVGAGGTITALPVFGADGKPLAGNAKPLTETQGKATTFAARMTDAEGIIKAMEKQGVSGSDFRTMAAGNMLTNFAASPEGQQYRQAQENWVTANLRQESGAAIGKDEMDKDVRKFFPIAGDSAAVKAQKQTARSVATQGMLTQAGAGAKTIPGILTRAGSKASPAAPTQTTAGATVSNW